MNDSTLAARSAATRSWIMSAIRSMTSDFACSGWVGIGGSPLRLPRGRRRGEPPMPTQPEQAKSEVMDRIADMIQERVAADRAAKVESFMRQFYRRVDPADLLQRTVPDLYGAALAQWSFARQRMPGAAKVRVYSPRFEEHGWRSVHSVVEIVTDDMPFLVDSVSMELNRQGLVIHLPIHPVLTVRRDDKGELLEVLPADASPAGGLRESIIHIEVDRQTEPEVLERIHQGIERVLA